MASKYRDRILQSSGVSNIRVESEYATKLMLSMGWKEGNGLGKNQHGTKDCIQVRRKDDNVGLGKKALGGPTNWKDQWWNEKYNDAIKKLNILPNKFKRKIVVDEESSCSSDDSSDDSSNSNSSSMPALFTKRNKLMQKKSRKAQDSDDSSDDSTSPDVPSLFAKKNKPMPKKHRKNE